MNDGMNKPELSNISIGEKGQINASTNSQYEYHLTFWGQIENDNLVEKELGINEKDFWFRTKEEREMMKTLILNIADRHKVIAVFAEHEGHKVRYKTIAKMVFEYEGNEYPYEHDFGYGYPKEAARYMFEDGNYSCDCNRSLFLADAYPESFTREEELECGHRIVMKGFTVCFR